MLWKNPGNLTEPQQLKLARVQQLNQRLYRAYLLAQQLRQIYRVPADQAIGLLDAWLRWARRCRLKPFVKLAGPSPSSATGSRPRSRTDSRTSAFHTAPPGEVVVVMPSVTGLR